MEDPRDEKPGAASLFSALSDVDIDTLVEAGFNKSRAIQPSQDFHLRKFTSEGQYFEQLPPAEYYNDEFGDFSPRHINVEQSKDDSEKELPGPQLDTHPVDNGHQRSPAVVKFPNLAHPSELQAFTSPESQTNYHTSVFSKDIQTGSSSFSLQQPMVLETSVLPQREWDCASRHPNGIVSGTPGFGGLSIVDGGGAPSVLPTTPTRTSYSSCDRDHVSRSETMFCSSREDAMSMSPMKELRKQDRRNCDSSRDTSKSDLLRVPEDRLGASRVARKGPSRRRSSATAHLSLEEKKKLRAARNRQSAEKSRMRRKLMIFDLETNVARLREENRDLKAKVERYHGHLLSTSAEVKRRSEGLDPSAAREETAMPVLYEALSALQRCMDECPRTFRKGAHSPPIPLNIRRAIPRSDRINSM